MLTRDFWNFHLKYGEEQSFHNVSVEVMSANFDQHQDSSFRHKQTATLTHEGVPEEFDHFPQILFIFSIFIPCAAWEWDRLIIGRYSRTW